MGTEIIKRCKNGKRYAIHVYEIIGTGHMVADVWEQSFHPLSPEGQAYGHSTITTFGGVWFGKIGTRRLPEWIDKIPGLGHKTCDERIRLCRRFQEQQARIVQCVLAGHVPPMATFQPEWHEATWTKAE